MTDRKPERRGLGRGLSALMADVGAAPAIADAPRKPDSRLPIELVHPNPNQPRRDFDPDALAELAASLKAKGVIQPLIVRPHPDRHGEYEIVAGERRWRAAQMAQLHDVPVLIREFDDTEVLEVAIIENIQRADLNPVEEALGYRQLIEKFGHTQEKLAEALSKSRSHVANSLRLLQLPDDVLQMLRHGKLTAGHARALITTESPSALATKVVSQGLSVRETEKLAKEPTPQRTPRPRGKVEKDADTRALEADLSANLKMKVQIDHKGQDGGVLTISYRSLDQLDQLCQALSGYN